MDAETANAIVTELLHAIRRRNTITFAVRHMRGGDPVPEAWLACTLPDTLVALYHESFAGIGFELDPFTVCNDIVCEACAQSVRRAANLSDTSFAFFTARLA